MCGAKVHARQQAVTSQAGVMTCGVRGASHSVLRCLAVPLQVGDLITNAKVTDGLEYLQEPKGAASTA